MAEILNSEGPGIKTAIQWNNVNKKQKCYVYKCTNFVLNSGLEAIKTI